TAIVVRGLGTVHVPILMYHYIGQVAPGNPNPQLAAGLTVSPGMFQQQMAWLAANGYHPITMAMLCGYLQGANDLPAKPVALTFDDGYADFYTNAFPILSQYHFTATTFIISGFIDDANGHSMRSWQLRAINQAGIEIGAHTFNHLDLTTLSPAQVQNELGPPKATLEKLIGKPVLDFAYPAGRYNSSVVAAVQAAGYESAVTTQPGTTHAWADRFTWTRQEVTGTESLTAFTQQLGPTDPTTVAVPRWGP
ncbi:MAG: polysaccharide deacetylase family protein, partial [Candidatus Dormibacteraeota bacterium]|nr:polysaccharide deacetylase family protein [Candidatus Dormibacteraeota bacterium]